MKREEIGNPYIVRRLESGETITAFNCGDEDLNDFILSEAPLYNDAFLAVTYVIENKQTKEVIAFFSLSNDRVSLSDFENTTEFNRFRRKRFANEKRLKSYPAVKIGRLGVSESAKGMALGSRILNLAKWMYMSNNRAGCRFVTVDAYKNAVPFYEKNKFNLLLSTMPEDNTTIPMYFDLKDLSV